MADNQTNIPLPSLGRQRLGLCAVKRVLAQYSDVHSHDTTRAHDGDTVVSIGPGDAVEPGGTYSVGIHPWNTLREPTLSELKALVRLARMREVVAIGECGFDKLRGGPAESQERVFDFHARLAERLGKPLIIHAVKSDDRLAAAIKCHRPTVEWIIHGYRGNVTRARALVALGYSLSLGRRHNPAVAESIPPARLYRESDAQP